MSLTAGYRIAQYEIVAPLGSSGMGEVYRARDARLGREVAIKVMTAHIAADPEMRRRFETEARAVASLSHSAILSIYEMGRNARYDALLRRAGVPTVSAARITST